MPSTNFGSRMLRFVHEEREDDQCFHPKLRLNRARLQKPAKQQKRKGVQQKQKTTTRWADWANQLKAVNNLLLGRCSKVCTLSGMWLLWTKVLRQCLWEACRVLQVSLTEKLYWIESTLTQIRRRNENMQQANDGGNDKSSNQGKDNPNGDFASKRRWGSG